MRKKSKKDADGRQISSETKAPAVGYAKGKTTVLDGIFVTRSQRKTMVLGIDRQLHLYVRAPLQVTDAQIRAFVDSRRAWIREHMAQLTAEQAYAEQPLTEEEIRALAARAAAYLPERVAYFARQLGVEYGRISIRCQKSRYGSCSAAGNLNFNCLLMLMPPEMIDYVVAHEVCHRRQMNHSPQFYALLATLLPDHRQRQAWLKQNGGRILARAEKIK